MFHSYFNATVQIILDVRGSEFTAHRAAIAVDAYPTTSKLSVILLLVDSLGSSYMVVELFLAISLPFINVHHFLFKSDSEQTNIKN